MPVITVKIARTDGKSFSTREAFIETTKLSFNNDVATVNKPGQKANYRLTWMVTGAPGEYQVHITTPPEAVDTDANARKRKINIDGFGAGQRKFKVN